MILKNLSLLMGQTFGTIHDLKRFRATLSRKSGCELAPSPLALAN
jgi:hypothetical protein